MFSSRTSPCVALRMWAMTWRLRMGYSRTMAATGEVVAGAASMKCRRPRPSKKAMPKPSLCSTARVAKPVKLNTRSVGVLAFMPSSWHMVGRGPGGVRAIGAGASRRAGAVRGILGSPFRVDAPQATARCTVGG